VTAWSISDIWVGFVCDLLVYGFVDCSADPKASGAVHARIVCVPHAETVERFAAGCQIIVLYNNSVGTEVFTAVKIHYDTVL
jgi:hypothetical protein